MATERREAIEAEMEQTRQELAANLDQLLYRSSPKTIANRQVASVKAFFVDPQTGVRTDNVVKVVAGVVGTVVVLYVVRKVAG